MGATENRLHQLLALALAIAFTVSLVSAAGIAAGANGGNEHDYRTNSVDELTITIVEDLRTRMAMVRS